MNMARNQDRVHEVFTLLEDEGMLSMEGQVPGGCRAVQRRQEPRPLGG